MESLIHAGAANEVKVNIRWIYSGDVNETTAADLLGGADAVLVAPGFGERGIEGKIAAVRYARENGIPFLGICLGMQMAVVEYARDVLGLKNAHSSEIDPLTDSPVIDLMASQKEITDKGGTMRLGAWQCSLEKGSLASDIYGGAEEIFERHRHRYELNSQYLEALEQAGMKATGRNADTGLVDIVEVPSHPWFVGVQFHPEYRSKVEAPHPLFVRFVEAATRYRAAQNEK